MFNFLFAQVLHRWTAVAGFRYAGNMADVSNTSGCETSALESANDRGQAGSACPATLPR